MTDAIDDLIAGVIKREGGWVDRADDRGGPTMYGVTLPVYSQFRRTPMTVAELQRLSVAEATEIYRKLFVLDPGFDRIADPALRELVVDCGVNHGLQRAIKWLQVAVGVTPDGDFGPTTEHCVNAYSPRALRAKIAAQRGRFFGEIIDHDHTQAVYAAGWLNRLATFIEALA